MHHCLWLANVISEAQTEADLEFTVIWFENQALNWNRGGALSSKVQCYNKIADSVFEKMFVKGYILSHSLWWNSYTPQ